MTIIDKKSNRMLNKIFAIENIEEKLTPKYHESKPNLRLRHRVNIDNCNQRWSLTSASENSRNTLLSQDALDNMEVYQDNIENYIGTVKIPVGLAGPLRVNGAYAQGDYYVPLATTEAALVASYSRGAQLITAAGGCTTIITNEAINRTPGFIFNSVLEASQFVTWIEGKQDTIKNIAETTTRHGKLINVNSLIEACLVFMHFEYLTGNAAGQNMVTVATDAILTFIKENCPIKPQHQFLDSNRSSDKKVSLQSLMHVRGKKVIAEANLSDALITKYLSTTSEKMMTYWDLAHVGSTLSGTVGANAQLSNALAAIYLACGQDVACVNESAVGFFYCAKRTNGLYVSVTLPNIITATVGGGTQLPSQKACLDILGLQPGENSARELAEIIAGICLAGEISLCAAICADHFSEAHAALSRRKIKFK